MINLLRCDDRLIHGQCMTRIVQHFFIKRIIVVDDFTATNPILKLVFEKAVPPSMVANVYTLSESIEKIKEAVDSKEGTLVLFKSPTTALSLFEEIDGLPKSLMVGPISSKAGAKEATFGTYLLQTEVDAVEKMVSSMGVDVHFQVLPDQKKNLWSELKNKF